MNGETEAEIVAFPIILLDWLFSPNAIVKNSLLLECA